MGLNMRIGVVVLDRYAKYDQFDPLSEKLDLFHEECAGGRVRIESPSNEVRLFRCDACGADSNKHFVVELRILLRQLLACRTRLHTDGGDIVFTPIPPPPPARVCRACDSPVDPKTAEYAVFHFAEEQVVYVHVDCSPAAKQASPSPDDERLQNLLQELRVIARRNSEPIRRRGEK